MRCSIAVWFVALGVAVLGTAASAEPTRLLFQPHGAFFSLEFHQRTLIDPQVFCKDSTAPAAIGPQGIAHVAGLRNARLSDAIDSAIFTAVGKPLPFSLGQWLDATGSAEITDISGGSRVAMHFAHLVPNGEYSLFENHFDTTPPSFTPLDGTGRENNFHADADGAASVTVTTPHRLTHQHGLLVVYQSDGITHGAERGPIGVTAHHQLVVRVPER
jgi:hypothetical protein